jgi:hypothetical protein
MGQDSNQALRIEFSVERDKSGAPNNVEIKIYNLSEDTRRKLEKGENISVRLEAGYEEDIGQIFFGVLRSAESYRESGEWITRVTAGDEPPIRQRRFNKHYAKGTLIVKILEDLITTAGIKAGNVDSSTDIITFTTRTSASIERGLHLQGYVTDVLAAFARSCGFSWSIQDGAILLVGGDLPPDPRIGPRLTPETGLVGLPSVDTKTKNVTGTCLLTPRLLPGLAFRVEASTVNGRFLCVATNHRGDSHSAGEGAWVTEFQGEQLVKSKKK